MNKTFSEEIIAEWLQLKGWYIQTGVPLGSKEVGGRGEADIIGLKIIEGQPHIIHIEVGILGGSAEDNLERVQKKFSEKNEEHILRVMGLDNASWEHRYIVTYASKKSLELIRENSFKIDELKDVIQKEILPDIWTWKGSEGESRKTRQYPTPPNNLWLIQMIEYMAIHGIDLSPYWGRIYSPKKGNNDTGA